MDQQVKQWIDYAAQDLGVARHLFENYHPKPLEIVCYHCQQSAEKAIKAVIVSLHWPTGIPKSHDLSFLLNQIHNLCIQPPDRLTPSFNRRHVHSFPPLIRRHGSPVHHGHKRELCP